jgi:uncharacterized tellurite resistance protein B-like protein
MTSPPLSVAASSNNCVELATLCVNDATGPPSGRSRCVSQSSFDSVHAPLCLFGRAPSRMGLLRYGGWQAPEQSFHGWLERVLAEAPLPARAVRFVVAPHDTPLLGIWIRSCDAHGRSFPLVFARRVLGAARALPWPALLASCAHLSAAAESCLALARAGEIDTAWHLLCGLMPPGSADLLDFLRDAERALADEHELSRMRRQQLLSAAISGSALRAARAIELPAADEFDAYASLSLLFQQRARAPRGLFWLPAGQRMLVALSDPSAELLARLSAPFSHLPRSWPSTALALRRGGAATARERTPPNLQLIAAPTAGRAVPPRAPRCDPLPPEARASMPPPLRRRWPENPAALMADSAADPSCYNGAMAFWKRTDSTPAAPEVSAQLLATVRAQLRDADPETVQIVAAIAGLLACVAYSDRTLSAEERAHAREVLGRVHDMTQDGPEAICAILERHVTELATVNPQAYTRTLREHTDKQMRLEVLDVLLDLAAADGELAFAETQVLRRLTAAMGLEQDDYNRAQARHRERLSKPTT